MNIAEFARKIGVSPTAVSFAINNKPGHISSETRQMILRRMKELGFRPNTLARALATQHTRKIALWTYDIFPDFYTHAIYHLRQLLMAEDYELDIINQPPSAQPIDSLRWPVEGVVLFGSGEMGEKILNAGLASEIPTVEVNGGCLETIDYVIVNTYDASVEAVKHLINSGRRRIAYLLTNYTDQYRNTRPMAYSAVMREAGLAPEFMYFDAPNEGMVRPAAREMIKGYVEKHGCPDAIFGSDDETAIGAFKGLRELGIRIPDDVALIGCDGISDTEYFDPSISTIIQPTQQMCEVAWGFLKNRMANREIEHQQMTFQAQLALRGSSEPSTKYPSRQA